MLGVKRKQPCSTSVDSFTTYREMTNRVIESRALRVLNAHGVSLSEKDCNEPAHNVLHDFLALTSRITNRMSPTKGSATI